MVNILFFNYTITTLNEDFCRRWWSIPIEIVFLNLCSRLHYWLCWGISRCVVTVFVSSVCTWLQSKALNKICFGIFVLFHSLKWLPFNNDNHPSFLQTWFQPLASFPWFWLTSDSLRFVETSPGQNPSVCHVQPLFLHSRLSKFNVIVLVDPSLQTSYFCCMVD